MQAAKTLMRTYVGLLTLCGSLQEAALGAEIDANDCFAGTLKIMDHSKAYTTATYHMRGTRQLHKGPHSMQRMSGECMGFIVIKFGDIELGKGACQYTDPDGDRYIVDQSRKGATLNWQIASGTGKYQNMDGSGIYVDYDAFPILGERTEYQQCIRTKGEVSLSAR